MVSAERDPFPQLRDAVSPRLREMTPDQLRAELAVQGIDAEAAEDFFGSMGRAASSFGNTLGARAPDILSGAMKGGSAGMAFGPYGLLLGALGGGVLGGLTSSGRPGAGPGAPAPGLSGGMGGAVMPGGMAAPGLPGGMGGAVMPGGMAGPGIPGGMPGLGMPGGGGGSAASLLGLLTQPQVMQALMAMLMGGSGSRTVPVAGQNVPVSAIPNMIAQFANQASAEWEQAYGVPESETLAGLSESADSAERAQALAQAIATEALLRETAPQQESERGESVEAGEFTESEAAYSASYEPVYLR